MIFDEEADIFAYDAYKDAERRPSSWLPSKPRPSPPNQAYYPYPEFQKTPLASQASPVSELLRRLQDSSGSLLPVRNPVFPNETFATNSSSGNNGLQVIMIILLVIIAVIQAQSLVLLWALVAHKDSSSEKKNC